MPEYSRVVCNRKGKDRKGGGIGALVTGHDRETVRESCREHLWVKGSTGEGGGYQRS